MMINQAEEGFRSWVIPFGGGGGAGIVTLT